MTILLVKPMRAVWLLACVLVVCHSRQGTQTLQATSIFDPGTATMGITFPGPNDDDDSAAVGPALGSLGGGDETAARTASGGLARLQPLMLSRMLETTGQESRHTGGQFLPRPRAQASSKELLRRRHIDELLSALADDLPKQKKATSYYGQRGLEGERAQRALAGGTLAPADAPIYRNSRTYPSSAGVGGHRSAAGVGTSLRESRRLAQFAASPAGIVWTNPMATDGGSGGGQVVLGARSAGAQSGSSPPFFSQHSVNAAAAATKGARARARQPVGGEQVSAHLTATAAAGRSSQIDGGPGPEALGRPPQAASSARTHLRSGSEEVALHTPPHSSGSSDYEWKRVENSRNSWNNLRGMWGKRSPGAPAALTSDAESASVDADANERIKELLALATAAARDE